MAYHGCSGGPWSAAATIEPRSRASTATPVQVASRQAAPKIGPSSRRIGRFGMRNWLFGAALIDRPRESAADTSPR